MIRKERGNFRRHASESVRVGSPRERVEVWLLLGQRLCACWWLVWVETRGAHPGVEGREEARLVYASGSKPGVIFDTASPRDTW